MVEKEQTKNGFFSLSRRHASACVAGGILCLCFVFMLGYLVGQKHVVDQFVCCLEERSFAEQVYASLQAPPAPLTCAREVSDPVAFCDSSLVGLAQEVASPAVSDGVQGERCDSDKKYYAQLIGFRTPQSAEAFAGRVRSHGTPVTVRKRVSTTSRGTTRNWYQVVSSTYHNREELEDVVDMISRKEKLKGVRILSC